jgi:hypothetical protein
MNKLKVIKVDSSEITFDNGSKLYSNHEQDCCENHYLSMNDLTLDDFDGLEFNLTTDKFLEKVEDYGIALKPILGHPVRIPGYGSNNGYYSSNLDLVITNANNNGIYKKYNISKCQEISD